WIRRTAVLLLLALRTEERTVGEDGGLRRPRRLGEGEVGPVAQNGCLPSEGGGGVRATERADRGPRRGAYLHVEVHVARLVESSGGESSRRCGGVSAGGGTTPLVRQAPGDGASVHLHFAVPIIRSIRCSSQSSQRKPTNGIAITKSTNRAKPVYPNKSNGTKRRGTETIAMPKARNRTKNCFMTDESSDGGSIANRIHDSPDRCFFERRP